MEVVYERCCGLDVHKKTVVACMITPGAKGRPTKAVRTFGTLTDEIEALGDWLAAGGCTHVAMESTGVYWQPIWNLLEDRFELLLVNARHIKAVPGRKTDVKDCEWIADLLRHGLVRGSFIPDREQREERELARFRTALVSERTAHVNRLQKVLEGANIKVASVASDVMGVSAREMLAGLVADDRSPAELAELARGRLREKIPLLERALHGSFRPHHRFMLAECLGMIEMLEERIAAVSAELERRQRPFAEAIERLDAIPGVGRRVAETLVAELGVDLDRFPTARHLASWAGLCPGHNESAGKRRSGRTRKGNWHLRWALVEAAHAAARKRGSFLGAQYGRLAGRRGKKRAYVAVAHSILVIAYHLLTEGTEYRELGAEYLAKRTTPAARAKRYTRELEQLGFTVIPPTEAA